MDSATEVRMECSDTLDIKAKLISLSLLYGGAWAYSPSPFSNVMTFRKFSTPSRVPDFYYDLMWRVGRLIGYRGKLITFTKAQISREQNRGLANR